MKDFSHVKFVRWGNLNQVDHPEASLPEWSEDRWFHTAPCRKGIYAFPEGLVEPFLLTGDPDFFGEWNVRLRWLKDDDGNRIMSDDFFDGYTEVPKPAYRKWCAKRGIKTRDLVSQGVPDGPDGEYQFYICQKCNKHVFSYIGELWHHLVDSVDMKDVVQTSGTWVKTDYGTYVKALRKSYYRDKFNSYIDSSGGRHGDPGGYPLVGTKDLYEVFIEKVK